MQKKMFINKIKKKLGNNQTIYNINNNQKIKEEIIQEPLNVQQKIEELLNRNGYLFNVPVRIILEHKTYDTFLAGKVNNHLITLDNDIINIDDIKDFIIKDE